MALLAGGGLVRGRSLELLAGVHMSGLGWIFLVLGVVVTIALGAGLMALVFYSSRHDYATS